MFPSIRTCVFCSPTPLVVARRRRQHLRAADHAGSPPARRSSTGRRRNSSPHRAGVHHLRRVHAVPDRLRRRPVNSRSCSDWLSDSKYDRASTVWSSRSDASGGVCPQSHLGCLSKASLDPYTRPARIAHREHDDLTSIRVYLPTPGREMIPKPCRNPPRYRRSRSELASTPPKPTFTQPSRIDARFTSGARADRPPRRDHRPVQQRDQCSAITGHPDQRRGSTSTSGEMSPPCSSSTARRSPGPDRLPQSAPR